MADSTIGGTEALGALLKLQALETVKGQASEQGAGAIQKSGNSGDAVEISEEGRILALSMGALGEEGLSGPLERTAEGIQDQIDAMKQNISKVEGDIEALEADASRDGEHKKEITVKRVELAALEAELMELRTRVQNGER